MRHPSLALLLGALLIGIPPAQAASTSSGALKAAITLNIMRYIGFPAKGGARTIQLCVSPDTTGASNLARLNGQRVNNRSIAHRSVDAGFASGCDVVVLGRSSTAEIQRYRRSGSVVIGDGSNFLSSGGTIGLVQTGSQIRFEVSLGAAREAGVTISSKLLRLAARVQQ